MTSPWRGLPWTDSIVPYWLCQVFVALIQPIADETTSVAPMTSGAPRFVFAPNVLKSVEKIVPR
jgi:hypothetical protein